MRVTENHTRDGGFDQRDLSVPGTGSVIQCQKMEARIVDLVGKRRCALVNRRLLLDGEKGAIHVRNWPRN